VGETVVVGSCNGLVHGVDKATGTPRWRYDASRDGGLPEFHGAPLVVGDLVMSQRDRGPAGTYRKSRLERVVDGRPIGRGSMADVVRQATVYAVTWTTYWWLISRTASPRGPSGGSTARPGLPSVQNAPPPADRVYFGADGVLYALSESACPLKSRSDPAL
jgi:hypothetical protein